MERPNRRERCDKLQEWNLQHCTPLSVNDHIISRTSWLDVLSTLSAVASLTNRIKLGRSILNIVVRSPVICANSLAAIDILSSGRLFAAGVTIAIIVLALPH